MSVSRAENIVFISVAGVYPCRIGGIKERYLCTFVRHDAVSPNIVLETRQQKLLVLCIGLSVCC